MGSLKRKARVDQTGRNPDKIGSEDRVLITRRSFWHAPHVAALSGAGRALVTELQSMFNGSNNGTLFLSVRDAADRLGFSDLEAAQRAMAELEDLGLVTITIDSSFAMKAGEVSRARAYRLNWIGPDGKCVSADKLPALDFADLTTRQKKRIAKRSQALDRYLKEQREKKSAVRESLTLMDQSVRETRTEAANSVRETRTPEQGNSENPPTPHVRESLTHILHHIPGAGADPDNASPSPFNLSEKLGSVASDLATVLDDAVTTAWTIAKRDDLSGDFDEHSDLASLKAQITDREFLKRNNWSTSTYLAELFPSYLDQATPAERLTLERALECLSALNLEAKAA